MNQMQTTTIKTQAIIAQDPHASRPSPRREGKPPANLFRGLASRIFARCFAPQISFCNIAEGQSVTGNKSYLPDTAIANRYNLVVLGSSPTNITPGATNTEIPLGVCTDSADSSDLDVPVNVALLGCAKGTLKVVLGGSVTAGDFLQSNGDGTAIKLLTTTGTFYIIGRALMTGVAGDVIEFAHSFPIKVVNP